MAAAAGTAEEQPLAWRGWWEDAASHRVMGNLGVWGLSPYPGLLLPACVAADEGRSACLGLLLCCNPVLFALPSSSDAVTWSDPGRWKPPKDVGDPQGVEAGKSLEP